jgi:PAS domain S-box-containing protein
MMGPSSKTGEKNVKEPNTEQHSDILVVDDELSSRTWARVHLQQAGYTVREAKDADEALAAIAVQSPDLILLDVMLPREDGFELTRTLRRDPALATVPIILITVLDDPDSKVRGLEAGANDFLTKPAEQSELLARVRTLLRAKYDQEERLAEKEKVALVYRVSRELSADLDLGATLSRVLELTIAAFGATRGSLILLDEDGGVLRHIFAHQGQVTTVSNAVQGRVVQDGLASWVVQHREGVILSDARQDPRWLAVGYSTFVTRSVLSVPLIHPDRVAGVLTLTHERANFFTRAHLDLITSIASQAAVALVNARLFEVVKQERARLEAVVAGTDDAIVATDREQRIMLLNPAAERAFGISFVEVAFRPLGETFPHQRLVEAFHQAQSEGQTPSGELTLPNGRVLFFTISHIVAGPRGEGGWVAVMQDITHLKQLDRMKNEFVSVVSHDLRTPLATIHGFADVLTRMLEGEAREYAERIKVQATRTAQLVEELLDLGKIESGMDAAQARCMLDAIIAEALEAARFQAEAGGVAINTEVPALEHPVLGNPVRLRQVVDNLIGNALKYTPSGGSVTVRAWENNGQATVTVQDNGVGIPRESLPRIFEKFYRVPLAGTAKAAGTGLGLAIVKAIVEHHGGQVWVESEVGVGSTFGFTLPYAGD